MRQQTNADGSARSATPGWLTGLLWVAVAGAATGQSVAALSRPFHRRLDDLQMYHGSVGSLVAGGSLYDYAFPPTGAPFTYPPFAGLLLRPVVWLDIGVLMAAWTVATVIAVVVLVSIVDKMAGLHRALPQGASVPAVALLFFLSNPVSSNLRFGQISFFVIFAVLLDCLKVVPARFAGVATGAAAAVKLTPLIFIPYFWFAGQRRTAVVATGTFAACTGLGWALLPGDSIRFWGTEIFDVDGMGFIWSGGNQSLNGAMLRLGLSHPARTGVLATLGVAIVLIALIRGARAWRNNQPLVGAAVVGAAGLVFSPVSWMHHQTWLVLAALLPVSERRSRNLAWAAGVAAVVILPVTSVGARLPGGMIFGNARLLLAIAVACVVPFLAVRATGNLPQRAPEVLVGADPVPDQAAIRPQTSRTAFRETTRTGFRRSTRRLANTASVAGEVPANRWQEHEEDDGRRTGRDEEQTGQLDQGHP